MIAPTPCAVPPAFGRDEVVMLAEAHDEDGATFPVGTEGLVVDVSDEGLCTVEVLEPRRERIRVHEAKLAAMDP